MSDGVAIVGVGIHPFGRTDGVSGRQQGAIAARAALVDAGIGWRDVQVAFGGSYAAGNADALVADLGLTGIEFVNVLNGCATGGSSLAMADRAIRSGAYDVAIAIGFDKHPPGAFNSDPAEYGLGQWYGESGMMLTTQFFAMKIQRYLHDHDIDPAVLSMIAAKAYRNGARNPNAWRRTPLSVEEIADSAMVSDPLTKYMFCSPSEGAVALVLARGDLVDRFPAPPVWLRACEMRSRVVRHVRGVQPVAGSRARRRSDHHGGPGGVRARRHRPGRHRRRPGPGHRVRRRADAHGRDRAVRPRRAGRSDQQRARPRSAGGCRSTPTAAAWPTASRSARRACARCTRTCSSCAVPPASARCPANRRSPSPTSTAPRASAPARCCRDRATR